MENCFCIVSCDCVHSLDDIPAAWNEAVIVQVKCYKTSSHQSPLCTKFE